MSRGCPRYVLIMTITEPAPLAPLSADVVGELQALLDGPHAGPRAVAREVLAGLDRLTVRAAALVRPGRRAVLGITGSPGAGKTTLAVALVERLNAEHGAGTAAHLPMDGFHLANATLDRLGGPGGWLLALPVSAIAGLQVLCRSELAGREPAVLAKGEIAVVEMSPAAAEIACDAYARYGEGVGKPGVLNFGDCLAYGVAQALGEPLLFKGDDFAATDVRAAPY